MTSNIFTYNDKSYHLKLFYDNVINSISVMKNQIISPDIKIKIICSLLVINKVNVNDMEDLIAVIFDTFINTDKSSPSNNKALFDFEKDKDFIFSSFLQAYKINLNDEKGKLTWKDYIALFQGLPDSTKIVEVMSIRGRPIPKPTKYNSDERANLIKLKNYYSLNKENTDLQSGLSSLFNTLKCKAGD